MPVFYISFVMPCYVGGDDKNVAVLVCSGKFSVVNFSSSVEWKDNVGNQEF